MNNSALAFNDFPGMLDLLILNGGSLMNNAHKATFLARNARFVWLGALLLPPLVALGAYELMPHEAIWHEIVYSVVCLPIFGLWLIALLGCIISFAVHRSVR